MSEKKEEKIYVLNFAYYQKKDWKRFVKIADDKHILHDSWEDWHKDYKEKKEYFEALGLKTRKIVVNLDELSKYCKHLGIKNNGEARSNFVSEKQ